jgi:hypothetical protein
MLIHAYPCMRHVVDAAGSRTCGRVVVRAAPVKEGQVKASEAAATAAAAVKSPSSPPQASAAASADEQALELQWPKPRGWAEVALSKVLDTVEDVGVIARRTFQDSLPG